MNSESKEKYLSTMLALEKVPAFKNQSNSLCVDQKLFNKAIEDVKNQKGFNEFVGNFSDEKFKKMQSEWDPTKAENHLDEVKQEYEKFQKPQIGKGL